MGWYNDFAVRVTCPHCQGNVLPNFQASVGSGEYFVYSAGDDIFSDDYDPASSTPVKPGAVRAFLDAYTANFFAVGAAHCGGCGGTIYAVLRFEGHRFAGADVCDKTPDDLDAIWAANP